MNDANMIVSKFDKKKNALEVGNRASKISISFLRPS